VRELQEESSDALEGAANVMEPGSGAEKLMAALQGLHGPASVPRRGSWQQEQEEVRSMLSEAKFRRSSEMEDELVVEKARSCPQMFRLSTTLQPVGGSPTMARRNISRQVAAALQGAYLQKVNTKGKLQPRLVRISSSGNLNRMQLQWAKPPFKKFPSTSVLDLRKVILIGYGTMSRAWALFDTIPPEHCFSVHAIGRSYDFVCENERDAENFVLALSRLTFSIQGACVPGSISSHSQFVCASGWAKLSADCRKKQMTLRRRLLEVLRAVSLSSAASSAFQSGLPVGKQLVLGGAEAATTATSLMLKAPP